MNNVTTNQINALKENIMDIQEDIETLNDINDIKIIRDASPITLDKVHRRFFIQALEDMVINFPDDKGIDISIYFVSYKSKTISLQYDGYVFKTFKTEVGKEYTIKVTKILDSYNWTTEVTSKDYNGIIPIDDLLIWYTGTDRNFDINNDPDFEVVNRISDDNRYPGKSLVMERGGFMRLTGTGEDYKGGIGMWIIYMCVYLKAEYGGATLPEHGIDVKGFNGEEFSLEATFVSPVIGQETVDNCGAISLGNRDNTNYIKVTIGEKGSVKVYSTSENSVHSKGFIPKVVNHVGIVYSKSKGKCTVFINGVKDCEIPVDHSIGTHLLIGGSNDSTIVPTTSSPYPRIGLLMLKDFRLYNRLLTDEEVINDAKLLKTERSLD